MLAWRLAREGGRLGKGLSRVDERRERADYKGRSIRC
jgi:hypothetical protein